MSVSYAFNNTVEDFFIYDFQTSAVKNIDIYRQVGLVKKKYFVFYAGENILHAQHCYT